MTVGVGRGGIIGVIGCSRTVSIWFERHGFQTVMMISVNKHGLILSDKRMVLTRVVVISSRVCTSRSVEACSGF